MKKTLTIAALVGLGVASAATFAWGGHGQGMGQGRWQGHGFGRTLTAEQRAQLQSMTPDQRRAYMQNLRASQGLPTQQNPSAMQQGGQYQGQGMRRWQGQGMGQRGGQAWQAQQRMQEDPSQMISQYPISNLTEELKEGLYNQYGEEKMAHDVYLYAYEKYGTPVFKNIANSEQRHMDAIKALLDRYGITPPSDYAKDTELAEQLKAKVDEGLEQALNVGVTIEEVDIKDIAKLVKEAYDANAKDLVAVYTNIAGGSYNHLRGFLQALKNYGYQLPDVSEYLPAGVTVDQLLQMRGPEAKKLFVEYVKEHYGIDLSSYECQPNQNNMQSAARQSQNMSQQTQRQSQQIQRQSQNMNQQIQRQQISQQMTQMRIEVQKYANNTKVQQYKEFIEEKYGQKINSFTPEQIQEKIQKIDEILEKIVNGNYPEATKELYVNVLLALKEALLEKLNQSTASADSLLNSVLGE